MTEFFESNAIWMPLCVFVLRVLDVSLGTLKLLFVVRGYRVVASVLAFVEVSVWLCAASMVFQNLGNLYNGIAFAAGFSAGTAVGMTAERWIGVGHVLVRIFTTSPAQELKTILKDNNFGATSFQGTGHFGDNSLVLVLTTSRKAAKLTRLVRESDPQAVMTLEAVRNVFGAFVLPTPIAVSGPRK